MGCTYPNFFLFSCFQIFFPCKSFPVFQVFEAGFKPVGFAFKRNRVIVESYTYPLPQIPDIVQNPSTALRSLRGMNSLVVDVNVWQRFVFFTRQDDAEKRNSHISWRREDVLVYDSCFHINIVFLMFYLCCLLPLFSLRHRKQYTTQYISDESIADITTHRSMKLSIIMSIGF